MLMGKNPFGIDLKSCLSTARQILNFRGEELEVAVVIGGGNMFRGIHVEGPALSRASADHLGMLATLMNGVALKNALEEEGGKARLFTALECPKIAESYQYDKARKAFLQGEILIFVGGTGNPYFTTDSAAALRACEMGVDLLAKATKVDGVYDQDPSKTGAQKYETLSYEEYLNKKLKVMDLTAVTLCMDQKIPIFVFNMQMLGRKPLDELISGKSGTLIQG